MGKDYKNAENKYLKMLRDRDCYSKEERFEIERSFSKQATEIIFASLILEGWL